MKNERKIGFFFALPTLAVLGVIVVYPMIRVIWLSFFKVSIFARAPKFNFFQNYTSLFGDASFWNSLQKTLIWTGCGVPLQVLLGLGVALLANKKFRGRDILRGAVFFPYLVPTIMATMTWSFMFNDLYGVVNFFLLKIGLIEKPICWFAYPNTAMAGLIVVSIWKFSPFVVLCVLAGLQTIPIQLYESAQIDGATALQLFRYITFPVIMPILIIVMLLRSIWVFNMFDLIYLLTQGGPLESTRTLPILVYEEAFHTYNLGVAASAGVIMLVTLLIIMSFYIKLYGRFAK